MVDAYTLFSSQEEDSFQSKIESIEKRLYEDYRSTSKGEFIFVIDRSGSMMGDRIENLKRALVKFIELLPKDSYFNIISFGFNVALYEESSVKLNEQSKSKFLNWTESIQADMGGTEILWPIEVATQLPDIQGYPRTIILITDGEVDNPDLIVETVRKESHRLRVCSVGIGHGSSNYLLPNIAKAGGCTHEFVKDNEDLGEKAAYLLQTAVS